MPSPQTNIGTSEPSGLLLCFGPFQSNPSSYSSDTSSSKSSSPGPSISSDNIDLANSILTWNSNADFNEFCSKIGILFNSHKEAGNFLNSVHSQQSLLSIKLDDNIECVEHLTALCFDSKF